MLHAANRYRHVVDHAEAFAVIGESVVESATNVDAHSIRQSMLRSQNRPSRGQPEGSNQFGRKGNFELHLLTGTERAGLELPNVLRSVDQEDVCVSSRLRVEEVCRHQQPRSPADGHECDGISRRERHAAPMGR